MQIALIVMATLFSIFSCMFLSALVNVYDTRSSRPSLGRYRYTNWAGYVVLVQLTVVALNLLLWSLI